MVDSWHIRVAAEPLIGRDGVRYSAWLVEDDRVIWVCPRASPEDAGVAIGSLVARMLQMGNSQRERIGRAEQ